VMDKEGERASERAIVRSTHERIYKKSACCFASGFRKSKKKKLFFVQINNFVLECSGLTA
jgi:hypothetical protein